MKLFNNLKKKFYFFIGRDIRWKMRSIGKTLGFKIYPDNFKFEGLKSIYTKFLFNLIFFEKILKKKKIIYENIKKNVENNRNINFLISTPGTGSTFVRHSLSSYFELYYKIGNGIPKYNTLNNSWIFNNSPIIPAGFWNSIDVDRYSIQKSKNELYFTDEDYQSKKVVFCRHPFGEYANDLFSFNGIRPVVLFREPLDWLISYYTKYGSKRFDLTGDLNKELIIDSLNKLKEYYSYWFEFSEKKNNTDYLFIKFDKLILEEPTTFLKIFEFYGYDCSSLELIDDCVKINSKENSLKSYKTEYIGSRFMNIKDKLASKEKIQEYAIKKINDLSLNDLYNSLPFLK
jgi:hypothetical protein